MTTMTTWNKTWLVLALSAAAVTPAAFGQPVRTQLGRQLDANSRIGSGGYNTSYSGTGRLNSQLYINGQVTGLSGFAGGVPYFAADQLRLDLPSARLSSFRRASVGVGQVLRGAAHRSTPYLDRTGTVFGLAGITSGLALPGTSRPRTSTPSARAVSRLSPGFVTGVRQLPGPQVGRRIAVPSPGLGVVNDISQEPSSPVQRFRPGAGAPFGLVRMRDLKDLAGEFSLLAHRQDQADNADSRDMKPTGRIDLPLPTERLLPESDKLSPSGESPELSQGPAGVQQGPFGMQQGPAGMQQGPFGAQQRPAVGGQGTVGGQAGPAVGQLGNLPAGESGPGQDPYADLLSDLRRQRQADRQSRLDALALPVQDGEPPASDMLPAAESGGPGPGLAGSGALPVGLAPNGRSVIVRALAGTSPDAFNRRMSAASGKLKAGRFYAALADYGYAAAMRPANPLARVGMGLARFAAGEPLSASFELRRAIELLPALAATRLELGEMVSSRVLAKRVAMLDSRLASEKDIDPGLVFLATFMHHYLGPDSLAKTNAARLKRIARGDELMQAYARYILTGRLAASRPATADPTVTR